MNDNWGSYSWRGGEEGEGWALYDPCAFYVLMCANQRTRTIEAVGLTQAANRRHWSSLANTCFCASCNYRHGIVETWGKSASVSMCAWMHLCVFVGKSHPQFLSLCVSCRFNLCRTQTVPAASLLREVNDWECECWEVFEIKLCSLWLQLWWYLYLNHYCSNNVPVCP